MTVAVTRHGCKVGRNVDYFRTAASLQIWKKCLRCQKRSLDNRQKGDKRRVLMPGLYDGHDPKLGHQGARIVLSPRPGMDVNPFLISK